MSSSSNDLILVANPGSASRKYALFEEDLTLRGELHVETRDGTIIYTAEQGSRTPAVHTATFDQITDAAAHLREMLIDSSLLQDGEKITTIGLRIVAPSAFFMQNHVVTSEIVDRLESLVELAPLHINATLTELKKLKKTFDQAIIIGVSDSAFHKTKPNYAWNYGINIHDADRLDIKRFGYHGISTAASVDVLWQRGKLPPKVIVCHLGSGSSVTGVFHGRSIDTTMGFTPLEGVTMATRTGNISPGAVRALQKGLDLDSGQLEAYLNQQSGLLGLGGSSDIRELLARERDGDHLANLALNTMIHTIHKSIGSMMVALNGADLLVFTGTVGERSPEIRKRIVAHLQFADFILDGNQNKSCTEPDELTSISQVTKSKPIIVIPTNEALEIARHAKKLATKVLQ